VPEQVRLALLDRRARGMDFHTAWAEVVSTASTTGRQPVKLPHATVHRRQWIEALTATKAEWEACWLGEPTAFSEAVAMVGDVDCSAPAAPRGEGATRIVHALPHASIARDMPKAA
jgi:hypothetical protein